MKTNKITSALLTLGLVSAASVAMADSTVSIGGQSYKEVFFTGSTAARGNIFSAVTSGTGIFAGTQTLEGPGGVAPNSSSSSYTAYGHLGSATGPLYCICFSFTGSEAGIYALEHQTTAEPDGTTGFNLPGTPNPTSFVDPTAGTSFSAQADISMADTSQAVSLTPTPALHDAGLVGVVPFMWIKSYDSSPDASYTDLTNVSDDQVNINLGTEDQSAAFYTGRAADNDGVYIVGRNDGSGTRVNQLLDDQLGASFGVDQVAAADATYAGTPTALTFGTIQPLTSAGGIQDVGDDGFDGGQFVAATIDDDVNGLGDTNGNGAGVILLGYVSIGDGLNAINGNATSSPVYPGGAKALTLNGVAENDGTVEQGTYSFWGHEHMYSVPSPDATVTAVIQGFVGTGSANEHLGSRASFTGTAAFAAGGSAGFGGGEATPYTTQNKMIAAQYMNADKGSDKDAGFPSQLTF